LGSRIISPPSFEPSQQLVVSKLKASPLLLSVLLLMSPQVQVLLLGGGIMSSSPSSVAATAFAFGGDVVSTLPQFNPQATAEVPSALGDSFVHSMMAKSVTCIFP
jgi:hypothetical protein